MQRETYRYQLENHAKIQSLSQLSNGGYRTVYTFNAPSPPELMQVKAIFTHIGGRATTELLKYLVRYPVPIIHHQARRRSSSTLGAVRAFGTYWHFHSIHLLARIDVMRSERPRFHWLPTRLSTFVGSHPSIYPPISSNLTLRAHLVLQSTGMHLSYSVSICIIQAWLNVSQHHTSH